MSAEPASPWRDNAGLYFVSFAASALTNGLPQAFLLHHAPHAGSHVLALLLLGGTLANLLGIGLGARWAMSSTAATGVLRGGTLALWLLTAALTSLGHPWAFALVYGLARFGIGVLGMSLDAISVRRAGAHHRAQNDRVATLLRVLGMLSGILAVGELSALGLIVALGAAASVGASVRTAAALAEPDALPPPSADGPTRSWAADTAIFAAGLFVYAGFYVGAATLAGALDTLGGTDAPVTAANRAIALVFAVAATGVMTFRAPRRGQALWLLPSAVMLLVLARALQGLAGDAAVRLFGAAIFGLGFALLLVVLRDVATRRAPGEQVPWLRRLNRLPDVAAALGFALLALLRGAFGVEVATVLVVLGGASILSISASLALAIRCGPRADRPD